MKSVILQLFRRNPFPSHEKEASDRVHTNNNFRILSHFDGMCVQNIEKLDLSIIDRPCKECIVKCEYGAMAIHSERKKLLLYSREEQVMQLSCFEGKSVEDAPLIAFVSIGALYKSAENPLQAIELEKRVKECIEGFKPQLMARDVVFYSLYQSLSIDDVYLLLQTNSWSISTKIVDHIRIQLNECNRSSDTGFIQTYTVLGYSRSLENIEEQNKYKDILEQKYSISSHVQTIPGINFEELASEFKKKFQGAVIQRIAGSFDLNIDVTTSLYELIDLLNDSRFFGWHGVSLKSDTLVLFELEKTQFNNGRNEEVNQRFNTAVNCQKKWIKDRNGIGDRLNKELEKLKVPDALRMELLSLHRDCCQRLVRPQIWGAYQDVSNVIERYFDLLLREAEELLKKDLASQVNGRKLLMQSMEYMIDMLSILSNDRIFLDFPSLEDTSNSVYEKGAFEELIQGLTGWMQLLERYAFYMDNSDTELSMENEKRRLSLDNELFHCMFIFVPRLYCQTKTVFQMPSFERRKRIAVVHASAKEMVQLNEILPTLAHEVGHYAGIIDRDVRFLLVIVCVSHLVVRRITEQCLMNLNMRRVSNAFRKYLCECELKIVNEMSSFLFKRCTEYGDAFLLSGRCISEMPENIVSYYNENCKNTIWKQYFLIFEEEGLIKEPPSFVAAELYDISDNIIETIRDLIRELNADMFMLETLNISFQEYLDLLNAQAYNYLGFTSNDEYGGSTYDDRRWSSLYSRVICMTYMFFDKISSYSDILNVIRGMKSNLLVDNLAFHLGHLAAGIINDGVEKVMHMIYYLNGKAINEYLGKIREKHQNVSEDIQELREELRMIYVASREMERKERARLIADDSSIVTNKMDNVLKTLETIRTLQVIKDNE